MDTSASTALRAEKARVVQGLTLGTRKVPKEKALKVAKEKERKAS